MLGGCLLLMYRPWTVLYVVEWTKLSMAHT
jgi:hypothetical protein